MSFIAEFQQETKRQMSRGRCLHFADGIRCNEIISSHSIQKAGQLALIAEKGHVYRLSADLSILQKTGGFPLPKKIGIRKASAFEGFCKHHDNSLFEDIDNEPLEVNKRQVALYAYRCLCREYFVKENAVAVMERMKEHPDLDADEGQFLRSSLIGHRLGFEGLRHHKKHFDEALSNGRYDEFEFVCFTSRSPFSLQLSGLLYPDYDFLGKRLQDLGNRHRPQDLITFFSAPTRDGWAFCFGWHVSSNHTCIPFMQSLASRLSEGEKLEDALFRFSFSCCENHAFRISWWDGLNEESKRAALERVTLMTHPAIPVPHDYLVRGCEKIADWNFEYIHTTLQVP